MHSCFLSWIFHFLLFLNLMAVPAFGRLWKTRLKNVPVKFLEAPANCNPHNFSIIRNAPLFCKVITEEVFLLVLVRSIGRNIGRRQSIRQSWGANKKVNQKTVKVAFLFGNHDSKWNKLIQEEQIKYQDIIQESFPESYANLHHKTVMAWKWASTFCPKSTFVIVCNDEIFVDIFKTVSYLKQLEATEQHQTFFGCWMENEGVPPSRNLKHKHGVTRQDYPGNHYAAFCNGNGYIASQQIIQKLYGVAINTPPFMPDDAWNGVLAAKLKLDISNIRDEIPISTKYKIIEQYTSLEQYAKSKYLLFPLDRKFPGCEACVVEYLWKRIKNYNTDNSTGLKQIQILSTRVNSKKGYLNYFFNVYLIFNILILLTLFLSKNKYYSVFLIIGNIFIITINLIFSDSIYRI